MQYRGEGNTYTSNQYIDFEMTETYGMYKDQACFQEANATENTYVEREELQILVRDAETPLYPGCTNYSKMSATVVLFKHKVTHGLSDSSFNEMLQIFCDMLPPENTLPNSFYLTKKLLKAFELGYEKIHACINDPKARVHHVPLGRDCWKVWVESITLGKEDVKLYKMTDEARIINEALGSTIAWPRSCIKLI